MIRILFILLTFLPFKASAQDCYFPDHVCEMNPRPELSKDSLRKETRLSLLIFTGFNVISMPGKEFEAINDSLNSKIIRDNYRFYCLMIDDRQKSVYNKKRTIGARNTLLLKK